MQSHTSIIISRETIKPASPTPSHLHTYHLSSIDQWALKQYIPLIFFYPKIADCCTDNDITRVLKDSLSQSLTHYYPLAGRMSHPASPVVDCNDHGVEFVEARTDAHLETFLNLREQDQTLYQLFTNDLASYTSPQNTSLVGVQLNRFACGGVGLAVSMSHVVADGSTLGAFLSHWASLARHGSVQPFNYPVILDHSSSSPAAGVDSRSRHDIDHTNMVSRKFVFPNSKLSELKEKVVFEAGGSMKTPSRVEVLTSLLYKTALKVEAVVASAASTSTIGCIKPPCKNYLYMMVNVRDKLVPKLPRATLGNITSVMLVSTEYDASLSMVVAEIKKHKLQLEGIQTLQQVTQHLSSLRSKSLENYKISGGDGSSSSSPSSYWCSSLCGLVSNNELDFGWGKPMGTTFVLRSSNKNGFMLIDTPQGDGIQAWVLLEKELMEVFQNDKEILSFCSI